MNKSVKSYYTYLMLGLCKAFDMISGYEGEIPSGDKATPFSIQV